mmetsp:Transcript_54973/g.64299  ORF Transcript_54973/g.64299 Transcript_54973/m.64299 type:complete len:1128 (+) Transcript_54973:241-3624(+)
MTSTNRRPGCQQYNQLFHRWLDRRCHARTIRPSRARPSARTYTYHAVLWLLGIYIGNATNTGRCFTTAQSTVTPTQSPSPFPTRPLSSLPSFVRRNDTRSPTNTPTRNPTAFTFAPSATVDPPSWTPSDTPVFPTVVATTGPSGVPSGRSSFPSLFPSLRSVSPTGFASQHPTTASSSSPSQTTHPSSVPSGTPSQSPTTMPSIKPSNFPSVPPSAVPSQSPMRVPSLLPSGVPSVSQSPTNIPSVSPSAVPSLSPSAMSVFPTNMPSLSPSTVPFFVSTTPTELPSMEPTSIPSTEPSSIPSMEPSSIPSANTFINTTIPTSNRSLEPSLSNRSSVPSFNPTAQTTTRSTECANDTMALVVELRTDANPNETSWNVIVNGQNNDTSYTYTVLEMLRSNDTAANTTVRKRACVPRPHNATGEPTHTTCYTFFIYDAFDDGICCRHGNGTYSVSLDGVTILSGDGDFGSNATQTFCTGDTEPNSRISTSPSGSVPSASPSWMPSVSWMPTIGPTTLDTDVPSMSPTFTPTASPIAPTLTPTVVPSASPTTVSPTVIPTVVPTVIPTTQPTPRRTQQPSLYPTVTRTKLYKGDIEGLYFVITPMSSALTNKGILDWKRVTQNHIVSYWLSDGIQVDCTVQFIRQIFEPSVDATSTADQPATTPSGGGRVLRRLREDDLTLFFSVRGISYRILNSTISSPLDITATNIAQDPFSNIRVRNDYITKLSTMDPALFGSIETLTDVRILDSNNPTNPSTKDDDLLLGLPSATMYALVGCVLGSVVVFFAVGLLLYVRRQKSRQVNVRNRSRAFAGVYEDDENTHVDNPPHHDPFANVPEHRATSTQSPLPVRSFTTGPSGSPYGGYNNAYPNNDDVSTLADPSPLTLGIHDNHSLAEYTVDYDYSKAYGGLGGNSIVSAAEGTLGSSQPKTLGSFTAATATSAANTSVPHRAGLANASAPTNTHQTDGDNVRQQRRRNPSPTRSGVPPRHPPPQSQLNPQPNPHPDPNSVVENPVLGGTVASRSTSTSQPSPPRGNRNRRPIECPIQNQTVDIFAPSGKLGVVIDTPNHDAPVIHAIKDSSVVANLLRVGDSLIAVDDQDVRAMSAVKVSKLISKKSGQATRKLTIVRSRLVE